VSLVVYLGQMLEVKVCVNLGAADVRMSEQFLHIEIASGVEVQIQRSAVVQVLPKDTLK